MIKNTKDLVGSGIILGSGASILGAMGQETIASKVISPAANMMGPLTTASYGMGILNMFNNEANNSSKLNKKKKGGY